MSKLGYTWYPKDWGNSDSVFELSLSERGLYREFIDFAMLNDNKTEIKKDVWIRKFSVSMNELNLILDKLLFLNLIKINENILFIPSCENRLNLSRGGKKGKPTKETILNLKNQNKKPISEPISEPTSEQREIESEIEREIESKKEINIKDIKLYFFENGYSESSAKKFYDYYSISKWRDSKGNKVKNWKQKAQAVWFKPENEIKDLTKTKMVY